MLITQKKYKKFFTTDLIKLDHYDYQDRNYNTEETNEVNRIVTIMFAFINGIMTFLYEYTINKIFKN